MSFRSEGKSQRKRKEAYSGLNLPTFCTLSLSLSPPSIHLAVLHFIPKTAYPMALPLVKGDDQFSSEFPGSQSKEIRVG